MKIILKHLRSIIGITRCGTEAVLSIVRRLGAVSVSVKSDEEQGEYYTMLPEHTPLKSAVEIASLKKI